MKRILALVVAVLLSMSAAFAESYYVVGLSDNWIEKYVQLKPVAGSASKYSVLLPAQYPFNAEGVRAEVCDYDKEGKVAQADAVARLQKGFEEKGLSFLIAKGSDMVDYFWQLNAGSFSKYLAPVGAPTSAIDKNVWVNETPTGVKSGLLGAFAGSVRNSKPVDGTWEIRYQDKVTASDVEAGEHFKYTDGAQDVRQFAATEDFLSTTLSGAYRLTIDVADNSWKMEYVPGVRVAYVEERTLDTHKGWDYFPSNSYVLTDVKTNGKFTHIYKGCVHFDKSKHYGFYQNWTETSSIVSSYQAHLAVFDAWKKNGHNLDEAMADKDVVFGWSNVLEGYSCNSWATMRGNLEGCRFVEDGDSMETASLGRPMNQSQPVCEVAFDGEYDLAWYPFLGGVNNQGVMKGLDAPVVADIYINAGTATPKALKTAQSYKMNYDADNDVYSLTLEAGDFGDGSLYFSGVSPEGRVVYHFNDAGHVATPTEANPDALSIENGDTHVAEGDCNYDDGFETYGNNPGENYVIYFKKTINADGVASYAYWVVTKERSSVRIGDEATVIRTYSNDKPMYAPIVTYIDANGSEQAMDVTVSAVSGFDGNNCVLTDLPFIPKNTGVLLSYTLPEGASKGVISYESMTDEEADEAWQEFLGNQDEDFVYTNYLKPNVYNKQVRFFLPGDAEYHKDCWQYFLTWRHYTKDYKDGDEDYIGFFEFWARYLRANMAYLEVPNSLAGVIGTGKTGDVTTDQDKYLYGSPSGCNAKQSYVVWDDAAEATGLKKVCVNAGLAAEGAYYNLQGVKVVHPTKGIYIHNGKKVLVK